MVKKALCICSAVLITALLPLSVSALNLPDGYNQRVSLETYSFYSSTFSQVDTFLPTSYLAFVNSSGQTIASLLDVSYSDFTRAFYISSPSARNQYAQITYNFPDTYSTLYVVIPRYRFRNVSGNYRIMFSSSFSFGTLVSSEVVGLPWSEVYNGGPSVDCQLQVFHVQASSFTVTYSFYYYSDDWGSYSGLFDFPVYLPLAFTTQESADQFVRDTLSNIADVLGDIQSGLFDPTPEQSNAVDDLQSAVEDVSDRVQSALDEMSVPDLSYTPPTVSIDGESVSKGLSLLSHIPWLTAIFGTAVACWVTHLLLYGVRK